MIAPHLLGDLPGMISLALIPALLWSIDRLLRVNRPADGLIVALITAGLALTDLPRARCRLGARRRADRVEQRRDSAGLLLALGSGALGIALAACFWLPALVEADAVQWYRPSAHRSPTR